MIVHKIIPLRERRKTLTAAYIRVSTKKEEQDGSFEQQKKYYEKLIRSNPDWEFAGLYCERISGTHMEDRPVFKQMVQDAIDAKVDLILCKSLSRWARNTVDALETIQILKSQGVRILFEEDNIDTSECGMIMRVAMGSAIAQQESRSISENIKWTYRKRAEHGIFKAQPGKYFGFNTDDGSFTPDENAKYVREIFKAYISGEKLEAIAEKLNHEGVLTTRQNRWTREAIQRLLRNEVYVGDIRFQKRPSRDVVTGRIDKDQIDKYITDHHEAIIERSIWERVQDMIGERSERFKSYKDRKELRPIERQVLQQIHEGKSNNQIAKALSLTISQEKAIARHLRAKELLQDRRPEQIDDRINTILEKLSDTPGKTHGELMRALGIEKNQLNYALRKMATQGLIQRDEKGMWMLIKK